MTTDATHVTGSPLAGGARAGDVLAERYELLEALDADGPALSYRALDHESERQVLVRTLAGGPLDERTLDEVIDRLRGLVGVGGRYLSSLLDADREGRRPFTIEAWPSGTQLSAIIEARRARGDALGPREVLPVLARIVAALAALPDPWHHGDVRAERVWVDTDGLRLTGAYLIAALPPRVIAERIAELGPGAAAYAPELAAGRPGPAADRWGVAAMIWEALTSRPPQLPHDPPELGPQVRVALRRLLDPEPGRRTADLRGLLDAIAAQGSLAVPRLDPEPHRPPAADIGAPPHRTGPARPRSIPGAAAEGTQEISFDQIVEERPLPKKIAGAAADGTQEIAFDDILEEAGADDTAKHAAIPVEPEDGLDPRLVRAALGMSLESDSGARGPDSLDPRLVRAALGVTSEDVSELEELPSDELEVVDGPARVNAPPSRAPSRSSDPARPSGPGPRPPSGRPSPAASGPRPIASARPAPSARASAAPSALGPSPAPKAPASARRPSPAPKTPPRSSPAPAAPATSPRAPSPAPRQAAADSPRPSPALSPSAQGVTPPSFTAASGADGGTAVVQRPEDPPRPQKRRSAAGPLIVIGALVLAIAIIGAGFFIRSMITRERDSAERSRHIQERLQQIRSEEGAPAP